ncbi:maestro heat-like repeat-containing protein family member 9 [Tupaia chinensis]|uniref:maestro heat-like repeat-containing protein family member 9 n=1 Tax=Tupaia chinensis TaxID=246437 RepID=UPI0003C91D08|nr:maestro heat-like repeat-containing protein family member 9 [Tupaia chinensis]
MPSSPALSAFWHLNLNYSELSWQRQAFPFVSGHSSEAYKLCKLCCQFHCKDVLTLAECFYNENSEFLYMLKWLLYCVAHVSCLGMDGYSVASRFTAPPRGAAARSRTTDRLASLRVPRILDAIYKQLSKNPSHIMKHVMLRVITLLTRTSPRMIIFKLLDYPVPADNTLVLMWHAVGLESRTASQVLKTILLILKGKTGDMKNALTERHFSLDDINMMPLAASQALCTLLPIDSYRKAMIHFFPQLLMALMFQHSCSSRMRPLEQDSPLYARDALRVLLNCSGLQQVDAALQKKNCWEQYGQVQYHHHGVYLIAKTLSDYKFQQFPETLHYLYKLSIGGPRTTEDRVIIIIFLTELLNNFLKDPFPEEFLILYRKWANDSSPTVSKLSLQKIASMAPVINEIESSCSMLTSILDALLSKDNMVVMQALLTLRELLDKLDRVKYSSLGIRITSSYLLLMDHISENIRSTAIRHFGLLVKDMSLNKQMLKHVVLKGLVPLILFLEESEIKVVKACKYTLEICDSHLQWSTSYFLQDEYYNFELVVLSICNTFLISQRNYITDLIGDTLGFLRSSRTYLRRAAVILIGYLAKAGDYLLLRDEIEVMLEVMEPMLQDEDLVVRELAEKTHKLFKEIAQGMTSSTIKRNFKKLVKFTYVKKLKPLYYYYQPEDQTECPTQIAKTKDKESLIEEKDENIMVKN